MPRAYDLGELEAWDTRIRALVKAAGLD